MGVKIIYSELSKFDLREIFEYIKRDSLYYAKREVALIKQAIGGLKINPFASRKTENFNDELRRELIFRNYLIYYRISADQKQIIILTIHHHARLLSNNPAFSDDE